MLSVLPRDVSKNRKKPLFSLLIERGIFDTKEQATSRILAKQVKVDGEYITSPSSVFSEDVDIEIVGVKQYVSRGGFKLEHALKHFEIDVRDKNCLDIGSSTGGFSDCLLQFGASRVACVDVNYGQLAWEIRSDVRTCVFERTNIKHATNVQLGGPFDIVVIDVSFIGLAALAQKISELTRAGGQLVALVKPQFEAKSSEIVDGKVEDEAVRERTVEEVSFALRDRGFRVVGSCESPILGNKKHNKEYLISATKI